MKNLSSENLCAHVKHLQEKYARGVTLVVHEPPTKRTNKKLKRIDIRIEEKI